MVLLDSFREEGCNNNNNNNNNNNSSSNTKSNNNTNASSERRIRVPAQHICPGPDQKQDQDENYFDHRVTNHCGRAMAYAVSNKRKFFVTCGYRRPHIPWRVPRRFYDLYDASTITIAGRHAQHVGLNTSTIGYSQV
jgi:hypothetical protein